MECHLLLVTLLLIIKKCEVSGQRTGRIEYGNPTAASNLFPDFYSCIAGTDQPYLPSRSGSSYCSSLPQIIIDNTRDDDDDWLSLLYFLIIALKDRKSGCSYKNDRRTLLNTDYRRDDYYEDRYVPENNYCEKCDCKICRNNNENNCKYGYDQYPFANNCNGGCNCIFIPYPIAVPINFANGQICNDVEICTCGNDLCNKLPFNGKDNEINVIINRCE